MNVLIVGDGDEERDWAEWFLHHPEHHLLAVCPGFGGDEFAEVHAAADLDEALATAGINLVIVGGPLELRSEGLRRAAAEGLAIVCLHPPGPDSEPYYQVALSRSETGAVVISDLPLRLHPAVARLKEAMTSGELGAFRGVRHEGPVSPDDGDLVRVAFARRVDAVRALIGEVDAVTASGEPAGEQPDVELVVQLRGEHGQRAEVRVWTGHDEPCRLSVQGSERRADPGIRPGFPPARPPGAPIWLR